MRGGKWEANLTPHRNKGKHTTEELMRITERSLKDYRDGYVPVSDTELADIMARVDYYGEALDD